MFQIVVRDRNGKRTARAFDQDAITIGRGDDNDVVLADASVSKNHARLERRAGAFSIVDLGSKNGVFVGGERAAADVALPIAPGEAVGIGDFQLSVAVVDDAAAQGFRVAVTEPGGRHHMFAVSGDEVTIGSDEACDLLLEGEGVAPRHARVVLQSDRVVVADLKSPAGTWLGTERLTAPQVVREGDIVRVGAFHLTFARPGRPGPLPAPPVTGAGEERTVPTAEPDETPASSRAPAPDRLDD